MTAAEAHAEQQRILDHYNARFAFAEIGQTTKKPTIAEFDPETGALVCRRRIEDFHAAQAYAGGGMIPVWQKNDSIVWAPASKFWLNHPDHRWHSALTLAPPGSPCLPLAETAHNLWAGFAVVPRRGDWSLNRQHLLNIVCAGDYDLLWWLENWLAALVQKPGQHAFVAPLLVGGQGTGKGYTATTLIGGLFPKQHFAHLGSAEELTGSFSEHLSDRVFVFADEAVWRDRASAEMLKRYITEDTLMIHPKHFPRYEEPSNLHLIIASNHDVPLPVERDDRRLAVFEVSETHKQDVAYFSALAEELRQGGHEAFLYDLMELPIDETALRQPPSSKAKTLMKAHSLSPLEQFWRDELMDASVWVARQARESLHGRMRTWYADQHQPGAYPSREHLGSFFARHFKLGGMPGWPMQSKIGMTARSNAWQFPERDVCLRVFATATGVAIGEPGQRD